MIHFPLASQFGVWVVEKQACPLTHSFITFDVGELTFAEIDHVLLILRDS